VGALDGLLVVALEQAVAAPVCTARLADGGARVLKVERAQGDMARHYDATVHGSSAYFAWANRGKESIALDLKAAGDRALLERMLARADVFVQNFAPGAAARMALDATALVARFPRLVAVDIAGYGADTSAAGRRAYDMLIQAETGICAVTGSPDAAAKVGVSIADIGAGMNAHAAILEALVGRAVSGRGAAIEISLFDGMADWMAVPLLHADQAGQATARHGLAHASVQPYAAYPCADGEVMLAVQNQAEWQRFCTGVLERADLIADPRLADNPARVANRHLLESEIRSVLGTLPRKEVIRRLEANRIAWGRLSGVEEVLEHPALRWAHARVDGRNVRIPRPAGRRGALPTDVPELNSHGAAIRREFAA
jgi:crotonobetainyl-CoA:carnitine CoA-transferase CaiB-like acyl-CoA transferase